MTKTEAELAAMTAHEQRGWLAYELMEIVNRARRSVLVDAVATGRNGKRDET